MVPPRVLLVALLLAAVTPSAAAAAAAAATADSKESSNQVLRKTQEQSDGGFQFRFDVDDNEIVGGTPTRTGEFPYYVMFEGGVLCGGSLISPNRVLTAGHCLGYGAPSAVRVGGTTTSNGEVVAVSCAVRHPDYLAAAGTVINDIAILQLETNVTSTTTFLEWNSNPNYPNVSGTPLTVAGFGKTTNNGGTSSTLLKVGTFFVTRDECLKTYSSKVVRADAHICGDVPDKGDCNGDSGGPLMDDTTGLQVGLVSFGYGGCASSFQDVYTKVATYSDWIQEQVTTNSTSQCLAESSASCFQVLAAFAKAMLRFLNPFNSWKA